MNPIRTTCGININGSLVTAVYNKAKVSVWPGAISNPPAEILYTSYRLWRLLQGVRWGQVFSKNQHLLYEYVFSTP